MRVRLFAPLRAKITSSAQSLGLPILTHDELASSFDHLVSAGGEHRRDFNTERLRSLEIDDELEASRLHGGEVGRLGTLENTPGVDAGLAKSIDQAGPIAR